MSQRRMISYVKPRKEAVPFRVVFSSTVATFANINVILRAVMNLWSAASLVSAFTVTVAIFALGMYISSTILLFHTQSWVPNHDFGR